MKKSNFLHGRDEVVLRLVFVSLTPTVDCFTIPGASERTTCRCPAGRTMFSLVKTKSKNSFKDPTAEKGISGGVLHANKSVWFHKYS